MLAVCLIRADPVYRRDAFINGLKKAGYQISERGNPTSSKSILAIWNRYGTYEAKANDWEKKGGAVLVAENGYTTWIKDSEGRQFYALSLGQHNGAGRFPIGNEDRFAKLRIELKPWQPAFPDSHFLVCGQRGIGSALMASPSAWHQHFATKLHVFGRPIRIRQHPGKLPPKTSLDEDLKNAYACCIWSSSSGVRALAEGYPVIYDAPHWICEGAASRIGGELNLRGADRLAAMRKMAWGQWSVAELESGEPFIRFRDEL